MLCGQRGARAPEHAEADVDRDVAALGPGAKQVARLDGAARPELDQRGRRRERPDLPRVLGEQRGLGARLVVLGLLADALEDIATGVVVEVPAVEPARVVRQAAHHRLREAVGRLLEGIDRQLEVAMALAPEAGEGIRPRHSPGGSRTGGLGQPPLLPSPAQRGTMWTWTWGIVCPVASPLLTPMVVPAAPSAARTGPASRTTARKSASAAPGARSSTDAACARGTTSTCPSASGSTSRKATTSASRATTSAGTSPATIRQKMQPMGNPPRGHVDGRRPTVNA